MPPPTKNSAEKTLPPKTQGPQPPRTLTPRNTALYISRISNGEVFKRKEIYTKFK
jgi:hypothetical protein